MTDTERKRIDAICEAAGVKKIDDLSDGFHTFRQLYYQRMMLFATIVKQNKDKAWKSLRHEDGELCFSGGWFIVGIDTPEGSYTYHYENKYFDLFDCEIIDYGKHWDGHTEKDVTRLLSLESSCSEIPNSSELVKESVDLVNDLVKDDTISRKAAIDVAIKADIENHGGVLSEKRARIINKRIFAMPSAQPELIRCKDCKYSEHWYKDKTRCFLWHETGIDVFEDGYCNYAKRHTDADMRGKQDE